MLEMSRAARNLVSLHPMYTRWLIHQPTTQAMSQHLRNLIEEKVTPFFQTITVGHCYIGETIAM